MIKNLFFVLLLAAQTAFAQIISKDPAFASNGMYVLPNYNQSSNVKVTQNSDGSMYFLYNRSDNSGTDETVVSKLTSSGTLDNSFGNNGETILHDYYTSGKIEKQTNGKLLVLIAYDQGLGIARLFPNGQIDTTFGINGISKIDNIGQSMNMDSFGFYIQNDKIIIYGEALDPGSPNYLHYRVIFRMNENGSLENTFGNNGSITTQGRFVFLDNQNNIIVLNLGADVVTPNPYPNGAMEKYDSNGQPLTSFGNNGVKAFPTHPGYANMAFMDSSNNIICENINNEIFRITPNGDYDNSFIFDSNSYPFNVNALFAMTEKNGSYYISGETGSQNLTPFISKLTATGATDPVFNYYIETAANQTKIDNLIINDNNIIASGSGYIAKYLLNNPTLSTADIKKNNITFENPVKQNLIFNTKEKVSKIEIYSADGKMVKTLKDKNTSFTGLLKGNYIAKVTFENGKISIKKLIKN